MNMNNDINELMQNIADDDSGFFDAASESTQYNDEPDAAAVKPTKAKAPKAAKSTKAKAPKATKPTKVRAPKGRKVQAELASVTELVRTLYAISSASGNQGCVSRKLIMDTGRSMGIADRDIWRFLCHKEHRVAPGCYDITKYIYFANIKES